MITSFENPFSCCIEDDFFTVTAAFLDTKLYVNEDCEELYDKSVPITASHYSQQLVANNCNIDCLKVECGVLFTHVKKFLRGNSPSRCKKITVCVIKTMLVTLPLIQMNKAQREVSQQIKYKS